MKTSSKITQSLSKYLSKSNLLRKKKQNGKLLLLSFYQKIIEGYTKKEKKNSNWSVNFTNRKQTNRETFQSVCFIKEGRTLIWIMNILSKGGQKGHGHFAEWFIVESDDLASSQYNVSELNNTFH